MQRIYYLGLILALMVGLLPTSVAAQGGAAPESPLQIVHRPCAFGVLVAPGSACIYGKVIELIDGQPVGVAGRRVLLQWRSNGKLRQLRATTAQRPTDPAGEAGFTFIVPAEVLPGTAMTLRSQVDGQPVNQRFILRPDPVTMSTRIDLAAGQGRLPHLVVRLFKPGSSEPINGTVEVQATTLDGTIDTRISTTPSALLGGPAALLPQADTIVAGSQVSLVGRAGDPVASQGARFIWDGEPTLIDLYPGWNCDYVIPYRGSKSLPTRFCLAGRAWLNGDYAGPGEARVVISIGDVVVSTETFTSTDGINFAQELGDQIAERADETPVRVTAVGERSSASVDLTVGLLRAQSSQSYLVELTMRPEWSARRSLAGAGRVLAMATNGGRTALLIEGSGLWLQSVPGGPWVSGGPLQPCREGAAVAFRSLEHGVPAIDCRDHFGQTHRTLDNGATWVPTEELAFDPLPSVHTPADIRAPTIGDIALAGEAIVVMGPTGFATMLAPEQDAQPVPQAPAQARALVRCESGAQLALTAQQLWQFDDVARQAWIDITARLPISGNLNGMALAVRGQQVVLGRATGASQILVSDDCGQSWRITTLLRGGQPITSAVSRLLAAGGAIFAATDGAGIWRWDGALWAEFNASPVGDELSNLRISSLSAASPDDANTCRLYVTPLEPAGNRQIYTSTCQAGGDLWVSDGAQPPGTLVSDIALVRVGDVTNFFAATSEGLYKRVDTGGWLLRGSSAGTLRLRAVMVSPNYEQDRLVLVGGIGTGLMLYSDTEPDLNVRLRTEPAEPLLRPGEVVTTHIVLFNSGSAPADLGGGSITVGSGLQVEGDPALSFPAARLEPGQTMTLTRVVRLPEFSSLRPGDESQIRVAIDSGNDSYPDNNSHQASVWALPPRSADLLALLSSSASIKPDKTTSLTVDLLYNNVGELPASGLSLTLDADLTGVRANGQTLPITIPVSDLAGSEGGVGERCPGDFCKLSYQLQLPRPLKQAEVLALSVSISGVPDRDNANNSSELTLISGAAPIEALFVIDQSRLALRSSGQTVRDIKDTIKGLHSVLKADTLDVSALVAADWAKLEQAQRNQDLAQVVSRAVTINNRIRKAIFNYNLQRGKSLRYVVLVGGDGVIPFGIVQQDIRSAGDNLAESAFALDSLMPRNIPAYAALVTNAYLSDDLYGTDPSYDPEDKPQLPTLMVGRLVEKPSEILTFLDQAQPQIPLSFNRAGAIGSVPGVTDDHLKEACDSPYIPPTYCLQNVEKNKPPLDLDYLVLGGHGQPSAAGNINANQLVGQLLHPSRPLVMTVSCHTGLSLPKPDLQTLPGAVLAGTKQVPSAVGGTMIASPNYAYGLIGGIGYNERLALDTQQLLLSSGTKTIGAALLQAKRLYVAQRGEDMRDLDWKVVRGTALYGLPMQQVGTTLLKPQLGLQSSTRTFSSSQTLVLIPGTELAVASLDVPLNYTTDTKDPVWGDATDFIPKYDDARVTLEQRRGDRSSLQPVLNLIIDPVPNPRTGRLLLPTGAYLEASQLDSYPGYDPLIVQALPLSQERGGFMEPADTTRFWEGSKLLSSTSLEDGRLLVRLWLGSYYRHEGVSEELLLRSPRLGIIYGPAQSSKNSPTLDLARAGRTVSFSAQQFALAYVTVRTTDGRWLSESMQRQGQRWSWTSSYPMESEFFFQVIDRQGRVSMVVPNSRAYYTLYTLE